MENQVSPAEQFVAYIFSIAETETKLKASCSEYDQNFETAMTFLTMTITDISSNTKITNIKKINFIKAFESIKEIISSYNPREASVATKELFSEIERMVTFLKLLLYLTKPKITDEVLIEHSDIESRIKEKKQRVISLDSNQIKAKFYSAVNNVCEIAEGTEYKEMILAHLNRIKDFIINNLELPDKLITNTDSLWNDINGSLKKGRKLSKTFPS